MHSLVQSIQCAILLYRCGCPWWRRKKQYAIGDKPIANGEPAHELPNRTPTMDHLEMAFHNPGAVDSKMD